MIETQPDIVIITLVVSYFAKNLNHQYTKAVKTILKYLKASCKRKINYKIEKKL